MSSSTQVPQSGTPMAAEVGVGSDPVASISGSVVTPVPAPVYIEPSWTDPEKFDLLYSIILSTGVTIDTIDWSKVRIPPGHFQHSAYSILDDIRHGKHNIIHPSFTPSNNRTNDDDDNHLAPKSKKRKLDKISTSTPSKSKPKPKPKPSSSSSTLPDHYYNPSPDPSDPKVSDLLQKAGVISKDGELNRKKRGRPAKDPSGISVNLMKQIALLDPNAPPPRKRGRPKKDGQDGNSGVSTPSRYHHDHEHSHRRRRRHNTGDDGGDGAGGGEFHSSDDERYSGIRSRSVSGEYDGYSSHEYDASPRSDKDHRHNEGESRRRRRRRRSEVDAEIQSELDKIKDDMDAEVVAMIRKADEELQQQQQQHQEHQLQQQQQEHQQQQQRISPERVRGPGMFTAIPDILDDNTEERLGKKLAEELTKLRNEELAAATTGNK